MERRLDLSQYDTLNPRRVHELTRQRFPALMGASREWTVVADEEGLRLELLASLIDDHVRSEEVLVEAHRKVGDLLSRQAALEFIATHVGEGEIRLTKRDFSGF